MKSTEPRVWLHDNKYPSIRLLHPLPPVLRVAGVCWSQSQLRLMTFILSSVNVIMLFSQLESQMKLSSKSFLLCRLSEQKNEKRQTRSQLPWGKGWVDPWHVAGSIAGPAINLKGGNCTTFCHWRVISSHNAESGDNDYNLRAAIQEERRY